MATQDKELQEHLIVPNNSQHQFDGPAEAAIQKHNRVEAPLNIIRNDCKFARNFI